MLQILKAQARFFPKKLIIQYWPLEKISTIFPTNSVIIMYTHIINISLLTCVYSFFVSSFAFNLIDSGIYIINLGPKSVEKIAAILDSLCGKDPPNNESDDYEHLEHF